jgi:hypothetical protein
MCPKNYLMLQVSSHVAFRLKCVTKYTEVRCVPLFLISLLTSCACVSECADMSVLICAAVL